MSGIDVHKDMIKVGIRVPGHRAWTRNSEVLEYRTFYGVLLTMAADLRKRGVTHVVMEASGVYTEPVHYALAEQGLNDARRFLMPLLRSRGPVADVEPHIDFRPMRSPACRALDALSD